MALLGFSYKYNVDPLFSTFGLFAKSGRPGSIPTSFRKIIPMLEFNINAILVVLKFPQNIVNHLVCCVYVLVAFLQFRHQWFDRFQSIENNGENVLNWCCQKQPFSCCFSVSVSEPFLIMLSYFLNFCKIYCTIVVHILTLVQKQLPWITVDKFYKFYVFQFILFLTKQWSLCI